MIEELLERINILEIISEYVAVRKIGKDWYAICPFHPDTKPSMRIREDKGVFFCFGCKQGGNAITFISKMLNLSFLEAARYLAERYFPDFIQEIDKKTFVQRKGIIEANAYAMMFFRKKLKSEEGKKAREYILQRGINEDMVDFFSLGFAPSNTFELTDELLKEGFQKDILLNTGYIKDIGGKILQTIFKERIIFPIFNSKGEVIGFGGRTISDDKIKYINSSESPVFRKREVLYGIPQSLESIRLTGRVIIVEGYIDVILLFQSGMKYVVAPLGSAITPLQINFLKRATKDFYLMFDGDEAGRKATESAIFDFVKCGIVPFVFPLPPGEDPGSMVEKGKLEEIEPEDGIIYLSEQYLKENKPIKISQGLKKLQILLSILDSISSVEAEIYIRYISEKVGISKDVLRSEIRKLQTFKEKEKLPKIPEYELEILRFAIEKPEVIKYIEEEDISAISTPSVKSALRAIIKAHGDISKAVSIADGESRNLIITLSLEERVYPDIDWHISFEETLKRMKIENLRKELANLKITSEEEKKRKLEILKKISVLEGVKPKKKKEK